MRAFINRWQAWIAGFIIWLITMLTILAPQIAEFIQRTCSGGICGI